MDVKEESIQYKCVSCHCKRELADFIQEEKIFKSCNQCRSKRVEYHAENREAIKEERYGCKKRQTCKCGIQYYLYCKKTHLKSQRHLKWELKEAKQKQTSE